MGLVTLLAGRYVRAARSAARQEALFWGAGVTAPVDRPQSPQAGYPSNRACACWRSLFFWIFSPLGPNTVGNASTTTTRAGTL